MLECVVNVSEGKPGPALDALVLACGDDLLDMHSDAEHNRSVITLVGERAPRALARCAVAEIDLGRHQGAHPRIGVIDVVPFVPLAGSTMSDALAARDRFCRWAGEELELPCFRYGPERTLPEVRRGAFGPIAPDCGPTAEHPTAGGCAVGARPILVAYNLWLEAPDLAGAKAIAGAIRAPAVRALGLAVGDKVQVSMNLIDPSVVGPIDVFDLVTQRAAIAHAELVGLAPEAVLAATPQARWKALDLSPDRTIEARLARRG